MPRFITSRDNQFFQKVNEELLNNMVETPILYYNLLESETKENIYGESTQKVYKEPIKINVSVDFEEASVDYDGEAGPITKQMITVGFLRQYMKFINVYPQQGDIIKWNFGYYEIDAVIENQLVGGKVYYNHSLKCMCHLTNMSNINIEEVNK